MSGIELGFKSFVFESRQSQLLTQLIRASLVRMLNRLLAINLRVERGELIFQLALLLLLLVSHRFGDVNATTIERVQKYTRFSAFSIGQSFGKIVLLYEQIRHREKR